MPSASELFYNRRHRLGRTPDDLGFESSPDRDLHLNINNRRNYHRRHDMDGGDSLRRSAHMRQLCHRVSHGDHVSARFDLGNSRSHLSNSVNAAENVSSTRGPGVTGNDRLPIRVVLARARLLERLRGPPPSRYRLNSSRSLHLDELRGIHYVDHEGESSTNGFVGSSEVLDLTSQMGRSQLSQELKNRPLGLTQEALDRLPLEIYGTEAGLEGWESTEVQDCGICLEIFKYGDELICLPCGHRFHSACLDPWVRSCGDCPYCRRTIVECPD